MKQPYDCRRIQDGEFPDLPQGIHEYCITLNSKALMTVASLGIGSLVASVLNQEYAMWEQQQNKTLERYKAALAKVVASQTHAYAISVAGEALSETKDGDQ